MKEVVPVVALLALVVAFPCTAQNELVNPNFDLDLSGWSGTGSSIWDSASDHGGQPGVHGSIRVTAPAGAGLLAGHQCVNLGGAGSYSFGGMIMPMDPLLSTSVAVTWYSGADCTGSNLGSSNASYVAVSSSWQASVPVAGNPVAAPGGAQSADVLLQVSNAGFSPGSARFDSIFFGPGTFPVALTRFAAE